MRKEEVSQIRFIYERESSFTRAWDDREVAAMGLPLTTASAVSLGHHGQYIFLYPNTTKAQQETSDELPTCVDNLQDTSLYEEAFFCHRNCFIGNSLLTL